MVLASIADVHLGKRLSEDYGDLRRLIRKVFSEMIDKILERPPDLLVVAGDLFDKRRPEIDDLSIVIEKFKLLVDEGIEILYVAGNHELPMPRSGVSSVLRIFDKISNKIKIVDTLPEDVIEVGGYKVLALPHVKVSDLPSDRIRSIYHNLLSNKDYDIIVGHLCVDGFGEYSVIKEDGEIQETEKSCINSSYFKAFGIFGHYHKFLNAPDYIFVGSSVAIPLHIFTPKYRSRDPKSFYIAYWDGQREFIPYKGIPFGKFFFSKNVKELIDYLDNLQRGIVRLEVRELTSQLKDEILRIVSRYEDIVLLIRTKQSTSIIIEDLVGLESPEKPENIVKDVFENLIRGRSKYIRDLFGLAYEIYENSKEEDVETIAQMALEKILEALGVKEDENPRCAYKGYISV